MLTVRCRIVAQSTFLDFLREQLPSAPARVLEVGCGQGELTTALAVGGHDVLGIDPLAPQGDLFRRIRLEDLEPSEGPFDAVVASHSLHHVRDLDHALDHIVSLLGPGGLLLLDEHGWDLADEATLDWLWNQKRALAAAGHGETPASLEAFREELAGRASRPPRLRNDAGRELEALRGAGVRTHAVPLRLLGGVATEVLEQALIEAGAIRRSGSATPASGLPAADRVRDEAAQRRDELRVDRVADRRLVVGDVGARSGENVARGAAVVHRDAPDRASRGAIATG